MNPHTIAQWLLDNPNQWFAIASNVASSNVAYAQQLAAAFEDAAYIYSEDDEDDTDEAQEWHSFDPDC